MNRALTHAILFSFETAVLLAVMAYPLSISLPVREWAYSGERQELSFEFAEGQNSVLESLAASVAYFSTWSDREFSERQKSKDSSVVFKTGVRHMMQFPSRLMQVRIDFYPKNHQKLNEKVPALKDVRLNGRILPESALVPFRYITDGYFGYYYTVKPFMNGWWRVVVPAAVVVWIALVACAWMYFRRQEMRE